MLQSQSNNPCVGPEVSKNFAYEFLLMVAPMRFTTLLGDSLKHFSFLSPRSGGAGSEPVVDSRQSAAGLQRGQLLTSPPFPSG